MTTTEPRVEELAVATAEPGDLPRAQPVAAPTARPRGRGTPPGAVLSIFLLGALAAWVLLYGFAISDLQEHAGQARLYAKMRSELAETTAPIGAPITAGDPVALLSVPAVGLHNAVVAEGTTSAILRGGPGHMQDTVLPGQVGTSVIFGKSVTFGAPFASITHLKKGAVITAVTGEGTFTYTVQAVLEPGAKMPAPLTGQQGRLVLITSEGGGWRSGWAPTHAVEVYAILHKPTAGFPLTASLPPHVSGSSQAMKADSGDLVALVLWLQGLLLAALGFVWAWWRWGRWQTWVAGLPVLALMLCGASDAAAVLLPNLI